MTDNVIDSRLTKLAWMAMDQTYQNVEVGMALASPNNGTSAPVTSNTTPWAIPNNGFAVSSVIQGENGGKFVIYTNAETKEIIVSAMGTNGGNDTLGWATNFKDRGLSQISGSQWQNSNTWEALGSAISSQVLQMGSSCVSSLSFVGDSKGGAQAQMLLAMYISSREKDSPDLFVSNSQLNLIAHSAPGVDDIITDRIDSTLDLTGINFQYSYASTAQASSGDGLSVPSYATDIVSQLGSSYLGQGLGTCQIYEYPADPNNPSIPYVHRLVGSGLDYVNSLNGGDMFAGLTPRTSKPSLISGTALSALSDSIDLNKIINAGTPQAAQSELLRQVISSAPQLLNAGVSDAFAGNLTPHSLLSTLGLVASLAQPFLAGLWAASSVFSSKATSAISADARGASMTYNADGVAISYEGYSLKSEQMNDGVLTSTTWENSAGDTLTYTENSFNYHSDSGNASFVSGTFKYWQEGSSRVSYVGGVDYAKVGENGVISLYNAKEGRIGTVDVKAGVFQLLENESPTNIRRHETSLEFTCGNETYSISNWFVPSADPSIPGYTPTLDLSLTLGSSWDTSKINAAAMVSDYSNEHAGVEVEGVTGFSATITGSHYSDTITGKGPHDILKGGGGSDTLISEGGHATLTGGTGDDRLISRNILGDTFVYNKGDGNDTISLGNIGSSKLVLGADLANADIRLVKTMAGLEVQIRDSAANILNTININGWHANADTFSLVLPNGTTKSAEDIKDSFKETIQVPVGADYINVPYQSSASYVNQLLEMFPQVNIIDSVYRENPDTHNPLARPQRYNWLLGWPESNFDLAESYSVIRSIIQRNGANEAGAYTRSIVDSATGTKFSFFSIGSGIVGGYNSVEYSENVHAVVRYTFGEEFSNNPWYDLKFVGWKNEDGTSSVKLIGVSFGIWGKADPSYDNDYTGIPDIPTVVLSSWGPSDLSLMTPDQLLQYISYEERERYGLSSVIFGDSSEFTDLPLSISPTRTVEGKIEWKADVISNATQYLDAGSGGTIQVSNSKDSLTLYRSGNDLVVSGANNGELVVLNAFNYSKPALSFSFGEGDSKQVMSYNYALAESELTRLQISGENSSFWNNVSVSENAGAVVWGVENALSSLPNFSGSQLASIVENLTAIGGPRDTVLQQLTTSSTSVTSTGSGVVYGGSANDVLSGTGNTTLVGGKGTDSLSGDSGATVYEFFKGDGQDTISDAGGADKLRIHTEWDKAMMREEGDNLIIYFLNGKDQITVQNWKTTGVLESLEFTDKTVTANSAEFQARLQVTGPGREDLPGIVSGTAGPDYVQPGAYSFVNLGRGEDYAWLKGHSAYYYDKGDGPDTLVLYDESNIVIKLGPHLRKEDIKITPNFYVGAYTLTLGEGDSITIMGYREFGASPHRLNQLFPIIELDSGEILTSADFAEDLFPVLNEDGSWDILQPEFLPPSSSTVQVWNMTHDSALGFEEVVSDAVILANGLIDIVGSTVSRHDVCLQADSNEKDCLMTFAKYFSKTGNSIIAQGGSLGDQLSLNSFSSFFIENGYLPEVVNDTHLITGGFGDDYIDGASSFIVGEAGDDQIYSAESIVLFNKGDGNDHIWASYSGVLSLGQIDPSEMAITTQGNNLVIQMGDDSITWHKAEGNQLKEGAETTLQIFKGDGTILEIGLDAVLDYAQEHGSFNLSDHLQDFLISSSTTEAYGGGLAAYYAEHGNFTGLGIQDTWDLLKTLDPMQKQTVTQPLPSTDALKLI